MEPVLDYLVEKWPIFAMLVISVIITAIVVWLLSEWYHRFVNTETKVDNLPCSKHDEMFDKINEKLNVIRTALTIGNPMLANYLSQKNSPRELSEDGKKLFTDIKGEEFLHKNKDILIKGIEDNNPKTPLDVEELSFKVLLHLIDDDMYIGMKNWVYNSSPRKILVDGIEKSYDITMLDVCFVLSLPLRNMYLELHKELL